MGVLIIICLIERYSDIRANESLDVPAVSWFGVFSDGFVGSCGKVWSFKVDVNA